MKKITNLLIVVVILVSLIGCSKTTTKEYIITLDLDGGTGITSIVNEAGVNISEPTITKEGYTFDGFYLSEEFNTKYVFSVMPENDMTLYARWIEINSDITVNISANITSVTPSITDGDIVDGKKTYELVAPNIEGYTFTYWQILDTTDVISFDASFNYVATANISLEAVYKETVSAGEPTLFYETNFEDGAKAAYAEGLVTLSDKSWNFVDALIGSLANDLSVSGNSVRIRDGYIQTEFAVSEIAQVIFSAGTYGTDEHATVTFQISVDKTTWVTVDTFTSTATFTEYSYVFNSELFTNLGLNSTDDYYLKVISTSEGRTNIDNFQIYTGEGELVDDTPLYTITISDDMVYSYLLNEEVDLYECSATHPTLETTDCDIIGTVDNTVAGVYEITYFKVDEFGNIAKEVVNITIISEDNTDYLNLDLDTYYDDAETLYGNALMDALHTIINNGFSGVTYGEARYILDETDQDPNNPNNLILVYLGTSIKNDWDSGLTWNREHVWPQSLLGVSADNAKINSASDLYNLMPANPGENTSRGNNPYSEMGLGYEPRDEVKGDVARALFYMMIMYDELNLVDTAPGIYEMGYLSELLQWHIDDPVDDFELNRLEVIYSEQHNRNPFVDYPHFVELIWFHNN